GLSAPDSMGAYLTFRPTPQTTDAERNCISNIRPEGLAYADAAVTLTHLLRAMRARQISGVRLKDDRLLLEGGVSAPLASATPFPQKSPNRLQRSLPRLRGRDREGACKKIRARHPLPTPPPQAGEGAHWARGEGVHRVRVSLLRSFPRKRES